MPGGDEITPTVNRIAARFSHVLLTQDWHPPGHLSFASSHPGRKPYETIPAPYGEQTLWPDHCVQGTRGAELHPGLHAPHAELVLRKGFRREIDSYSIFFENDRKTPTGLAGYLRERGLERIFLAGLAFDFCVLWSAEDARRLGFEAVVLRDACRSLDLERLGKGRPRPAAGGGRPPRRQRRARLIATSALPAKVGPVWR